MPLIVAYNISPLMPDMSYGHDGPTFHWRDSLSEILEGVTCEFWGLKTEEASCFFPHDPSVPCPPRGPYPIATLVVSLLYRLPDRTPKRVKRFRLALGKACCEYLNNLRGTTNAKVEVKVELCDPDDVTLVG